MKKGEHLLTWKCQYCGMIHKTTIQKLYWNFTTDRCNDVDEVFFFLDCERCNQENTLYTRPYNDD
jgi:hypothetical protein